MTVGKMSKVNVQQHEIAGGHRRLQGCFPHVGMAHGLGWSLTALLAMLRRSSSEKACNLQQIYCTNFGWIT